MPLSETSPLKADGTRLLTNGRKRATGLKIQVLACLSIQFVREYEKAILIKNTLKTQSAPTTELSRPYFPPLKESSALVISALAPALRKALTTIIFPGTAPKTTCTAWEHSF